MPLKKQVRRTCPEYNPSKQSWQIVEDAERWKNKAKGKTIKQFQDQKDIFKQCLLDNIETEEGKNVFLTNLEDDEEREKQMMDKYNI